jgi:hypothetical protein
MQQRKKGQGQAQCRQGRVEQGGPVNKKQEAEEVKVELVARADEVAEGAASCGNQLATTKALVRPAAAASSHVSACCGSFAPSPRY